MNNDKKMQSLYEKYESALPDKIKSIATRWDTLRTQCLSESFTEFYRSVHSLCGSSGTYGFMNVYTNSRELENYLKKYLQNDQLEKINIEEISRLVVKLSNSSLDRRQ